MTKNVTKKNSKKNIVVKGDLRNMMCELGLITEKPHYTVIYSDDGIVIEGGRWRAVIPTDTTDTFNIIAKGNSGDVLVVTGNSMWLNHERVDRICVSSTCLDAHDMKTVVFNSIILFYMWQENPSLASKLSQDWKRRIGCQL
jgi:hypothetical protein